MTTSILLTVLATFGKMIPLAGQVVTAIVTAFDDRDITAEEAEAIGRAIGMEAGPALDVRIDGHDVVHGPALALIGGGLARIARQVVIAKRG